jgi:hypothetical protein
VDWRLRLRICARCAKIKYVAANTFVPSFIEAVLRLTEIYIYDKIYELVPNRPFSQFLSLENNTDTHISRDVTGPYRALCFVGEVQAVRDHIKSLDPDLRSAYFDHRKNIVEEVHKVYILNLSN